MPPSSVLPLPERESLAGMGGPATASLALFSLECSLDTVALDALETVSRRTPREVLPSWLARCPATREVALLSTCHRVEVYALSQDSEDIERWLSLLPGPRDFWRVREGGEAVHHLFRVAAGRESSATGESEVSHQVRAAGRSIVSRHPRPILRSLFHEAASAAREGASSAGPAPVSIASLAAARLRSLLDRPNPRVLVVGSGTVGRQVVREIASFARPTLLFHERPPDPTFLSATGANAVQLDRLPEELRTADAVVTAAKFGDRGVRPRDLPRDHALVLVDLGMPRNVDPAVRDLPNVRLVDLEELHSATRPLRAPSLEDARVERRAGRCFLRLEPHLTAPWIDTLLRAAEASRRAELEVARPFLGRLDPEQEAAVDRLTRRLVARLAIPPVERIRALPSGPGGDLQRRIALDLLHPSDPSL